MKKRERQQIGDKWFTKPKRGAPRELTRCSNTLTESEFITLFIGALRSLTLRWTPRSDAWKECRKFMPKGRAKYQGQCKKCLDWFIEKDIEMDHIIPIGSIREYIKQFADKILPEKEGWQPLCKSCHRSKTHNN